MDYRPMSRGLQYLVIGLAALVVLALVLALISSLPGVQQLDALNAVGLSPQTKTPQQAAAPPAVTERTRPTATATIALVTPEGPTSTPTPTSPPTLTPTPMPAQASLSDIPHFFQQFNSPGPASLAMALNFWGWDGDQRQIAEALKPDEQDRIIMPYELESFVDELEGLEAVLRVGGDPNTIKAFVSAGYPVIVQRGFEDAGVDGWIAHYQVISGYDDSRSVFITQDPYKGPGTQISYEDLNREWRAFNHTYLVVYPNDNRQQMLDLLGLNAYDNYNYHSAEAQAVEEAGSLSGRDLFFSLFNQGTNRVALQDYGGAAAAFDSAFANFEQLSEQERPWRMLWYQTAPYFAYYFGGRYSDVITLATKTLEDSGSAGLEESLYWRARALLAMADEPGAIDDLEQCVEVHENFEPCLEEMAKLGISPVP